MCGSAQPLKACLTLGYPRQILRCLGECGTVWTWGVGGTQGHDPYPLVLMSLTSLFRMWAGSVICLSPATGHHLCDVTQVGNGLLLLSAGLWREPPEHGHRSFLNLASAETSVLGHHLAAARRGLSTKTHHG